MIQYTAVLLLVALCSVVSSMPMSNEGSQQPAALIGSPASNRTQLLADANNWFAVNLYKQLSSGQQNLFLSPFSISMALNMVYLGARGNTSQQMRTAMFYDEVGLIEHDVHLASKEILQNLVAPNRHYDLAIANKALIQEDHPVSALYFSDLNDKYKATIEAVNFATDGLNIQRSVNQWVNQQTRGKIQKLLEEPLDPITVMLLLNAIYFKGTWKTKFEEENTLPETFYNFGTTPKDIPMMRMLSDVNYTTSGELQSKIIELPYMGEDISMLVILPFKRNGLKELENSLTWESIQFAYSTLRKRSVDIKLPKWKHEQTIDNLANDLGALGISDVFDNTANLSGISESAPVKVSQVMHRAFVEVNEKGSEAAAVTGIVAVPLSLNATPIPVEYLTFFAGHPFIYMMCEKSTHHILFIGRVTDF